MSTTKFRLLHSGPLRVSLAQYTYYVVQHLVDNGLNEKNVKWCGDAATF